MIPVNNIEVNHEYHVVELNRYLNHEVAEYLFNQFGEEGKRWFFKWPRIYFYDQKDHLMFTLRWS